MSLSYPTDPERGCVGKIAHRNSKDAKRVLKHTQADAGGRALVAYHCLHCGWWHIGHPSAWRKRRAAALREVV